MGFERLGRELSTTGGGGAAVPGEGASGDETDAAGGDAPGQAERGSAYYKGMVTSPLRPEDASRDMLTPTLKLIGQATVVLTFLTLGFMASNGLL
eukprot:PRCOL_00002598-RA